MSKPKSNGFMVAFRKHFYQLTGGDCLAIEAFEDALTAAREEIYGNSARDAKPEILKEILKGKVKANGKIYHLWRETTSKGTFATICNPGLTRTSSGLHGVKGREKLCLVCKVHQEKGKSKGDEKEKVDSWEPKLAKGFKQPVIPEDDGSVPWD